MFAVHGLCLWLAVLDDTATPRKIAGPETSCKSGQCFSLLHVHPTKLMPSGKLTVRYGKSASLRTVFFNQVHGPWLQ